MSTNSTPGPVVTASSIQAVLAALVALGWVHLDDAGLATVATGGAVLFGLAATLWARARVTPLANPRDDDGQPLTPDPPPPGSIPAAELIARHRAQEARRGHPR